MKVINGNSDYFMSVDLSVWLDDREKLPADVTEASLMAKTLPTDDDVDAKLSKTLGSGITLSGTEFLVASLSTDFGTGLLEVGVEYFLFFGVKFSGDTSFREVFLSDNCLIVTQDGIRA